MKRATRTLVIADCHGHIDRLEALLQRAGVERATDEVEIVQLGDLADLSGGTREGDLACYRLARDLGIIVLLGNHTAALFDERHLFRGFAPPLAETEEIIRAMRPRLAYCAHGVLLTHAGLATLPLFPVWRDVPALVEFIEANPDNDLVHIVGAPRGGFSPIGGLLWHDCEREPTAQGVRQCFGHTQGSEIRRYGNALCIDVAGISDGNLAGLWLPEGRIVAVGRDAERFEATPLFVR
jgi:hypothetical protein